MIRTKDYFKLERNESGENVFICVECREHFIERDGQCLTDRELSEHIQEMHGLYQWDDSDSL